MSERPPGSAGDLGPNAGLVDEMYRLYRDNPDAVSPGWRDFFADYRPRLEPEPAPAPAPVASAPEPAPAERA
ncbi:MAG TPA: hypothetical protein VN636_14490, partial [Acidimicrobiia bacterium]|nr:hypothetical protein [Acidimicrobiia bacterium]